MLLRRHKSEYVPNAMAAAKKKSTSPAFEEHKHRNKSEITRMSTADLKNLGKEEGIENAENMTGAELKKALFDRLNL